MIKSPNFANISEFANSFLFFKKVSQLCHFCKNCESDEHYKLSLKNKNVQVQKSQMRFHENIGPIAALQYSWLDLPLFLPLAVIKVMKATLFLTIMSQNYFQLNLSQINRQFELRQLRKCLGFCTETFNSKISLIIVLLAPADFKAPDSLLQNRLPCIELSEKKLPLTSLIFNNWLHREIEIIN